MFTDNVSWKKFTKDVVDYIDPVDSAAEFVDMNVTITPDWNVSVQISWEPYSGGPAEKVEYMVYCAQSEAGPYTRITAQPIEDTFYLTDYAIQDSKIYEQYFIVECLYANGEKFKSWPSTPSQPLNRWHTLRYRDISRRERILLEKFVGIETRVFVPKHGTLRCKDCWDTFAKRVLNDHCETCYGTSYEGGYNRGMRMLLQYTSVDPQHQAGYQGSVEPVRISAWTTPIPIVPPHSILLRVPDRKAFRVEAHQGSTEYHTNMMRQSLIIDELAKGRVEYKLFGETDIVDLTPYKPHVHH